jgi:hypothetical protein
MLRYTALPVLFHLSNTVVQVTSNLKHCGTGNIQPQNTVVQVTSNLKHCGTGNIQPQT